MTLRGPKIITANTERAGFEPAWGRVNLPPMECQSIAFSHSATAPGGILYLFR